MILFIVITLILTPLQCLTHGQDGHCSKTLSFAAIDVCDTQGVYLSNILVDTSMINEPDFGLISSGISELKPLQIFTTHKSILLVEISHPPNTSTIS